MMSKKTWKPISYGRPMLSNARRYEMGIAPVVLTVGRLLLPFIGYTAAFAVGAATLKGVVPDIPINKDKVGISAALAGGGLTAYYLSGSLPEDWKTAAYAAAVAGVSAGAYLLFHGAEASKVPPKSFWEEFLDTLTPGFLKPVALPPPFSTSFVPATQAELESLKGAITYPTEDQNFIARGAENFSIRTEIYNPTDKNLSLVYDYDWEETPTVGYYGSRATNKGSGTQPVTLPAKQNRLIDIPITLQTSPLMGLGWTNLDILFKLYLRGSGATSRRLMAQRHFTISAS